MSVSITVNTKRDITCACVRDTGEAQDSCDFCFGIGEDPFADGMEINFSNANANAVFSAVGINGDMWGGSLELAELPGTIRGCIKALNISLESFTQEAFTERNFMSFGIDESGIKRRVFNLLCLLKKAQEKEASVSWG